MMRVMMMIIKMMMIRYRWSTWSRVTLVTPRAGTARRRQRVARQGDYSAHDESTNGFLSRSVSSNFLLMTPIFLPQCLPNIHSWDQGVSGVDFVLYVSSVVTSQCLEAVGES